MKSIVCILLLVLFIAGATFNETKNSTEKLEGVREYKEGWILELDTNDKKRVVLRAFVTSDQRPVLKGTIGEGGGLFRMVEIDVRDLINHLKQTHPHLLEDEK